MARFDRYELALPTPAGAKIAQFGGHAMVRSDKVEAHDLDGRHALDEYRAQA